MRAAFIDALADGEWVNRARVRFVAASSLAVSILCLGVIAWGAAGTLDAWGRPLGTDFSNVWAAGLMVNAGDAAAAWDWPAHYAAQQAAHHSADVPFYGWHYPPMFLGMAALLALLPYVPALLLWQSATLALALAVASRILPGRLALLAAFGFPAVYICLGHGQNGFLTAALLGGALLTLDRRPLVAGVLIGLLAYKPQFGLVLPVLLLAGGHHRAFAGAALTVLATVAATFAVWGWPVWQAFFDSLALTRTVVIEAADTGAHKIMSAFAAVRLNGGPVPLAWGAQAAVTLAAVAAVGWTARARPALRNAAAIAATLLATPYLFDYDLVALGLAIAFLVADGLDRGFLRWERSLLAFAYLTPLFARGAAEISGVPIGFIATLAVLALALRRAARERPVRSSPFRRSRAASAP